MVYRPVIVSGLVQGRVDESLGVWGARGGGVLGGGLSQVSKVLEVPLLLAFLLWVVQGV